MRTLKPKNRYQAMQLACDVKAEILVWDEDEDGGNTKQGVNRLTTRQSRAQSATQYAMGLGSLPSGPSQNIS